MIMLRPHPTNISFEGLIFIDIISLFLLCYYCHPYLKCMCVSQIFFWRLRKLYCSIYKFSKKIQKLASRVETIERGILGAAMKEEVGYSYKTGFETKPTWNFLVS